MSHAKSCVSYIAAFLLCCLMPALIVCVTDCAGCLRLRGVVENLETKVDGLQTQVDGLHEKDSKIILREICKTLERFTITGAVGHEQAVNQDIFRLFQLTGSDLAKAEQIADSLGLTTN